MISFRPIESHCKKIFIEDIGLKPEHAFRIDRKSDRNNLAFSSFTHSQIAKYVRSLPCLGGGYELNQWWQESSKKSRKNNQDWNKRYHKCIKLIYDETNILDLSQTTKTTNEELCSTLKYTFLPFDLLYSSKNNENRTPNNPLGIYDHGTSLYLDGKCPNSSTEMPKTDHTNRCLESDTVIYKETREQFLTRMTADFNKHLRENPNDIKQWLEFAKFQIDAMDRNDFGNDEKHRKVTNALLLEKQMSIIDRAIENNPKSVELLVYKYNLCKDIWDTDKLMTEWKNVMFLHPNNTWLWKQYLLFFQTQFSAFTITKFTNLYKKCFDMLKKIHDGSFQSHKPLPRMEENMLGKKTHFLTMNLINLVYVSDLMERFSIKTLVFTDIFSKYCQVLYQSGYHERAIANFQALIELNFFTPQHLSPSAPLQDWLAFFEPFWDSGLPRFGEKGALGWSEAMKDKEMTLPVQPMSGLEWKEEISFILFAQC